MQQQSYICRHCGKEPKKQNQMSLSIHEIRCDKNPNKNQNMSIPSRKGKYRLDGPSEITQRKKACKLRKKMCLETQTFECSYCKKDFTSETFKKSFSGLRIHESTCDLNPDAVKIERKPFSEETRKNLSEASKGKKLSQEQKRKISEYMKLAVLNHPESYTSANRGRVKQIEVDGLKLHGSWEVLFYQWAKEAGLLPERCLKSFSYEWNGTRSYYPDFYLPTLNLYIEVKGYETEQDRAKWNHFPERLIVLKKKEIEQIKKGTFRGLI